MTDQTVPVAPMEALLDVLCPMHVVLDANGVIRRAGPVIGKLIPGRSLKGVSAFDVFELRRPKSLNSMASLMAQSGRKLHFAMRTPPQTELKGVLVPLPQNAVPGVQDGAVLNLSFGISVMDAVRDYALTAADFAVTDLAVEMLYLVEAKTAVMEELRHLNQRLNGAREVAEHQAATDTLTGLSNRRAMDQVLQQLLDRRQRFALMHIDLDHFKEVNDTFGHAAGDEVLQAVARRLQDCTRAGDCVVRQGGDEFMLVLPGLTDRPMVEALAARLVQAIEVPVEFGEDLLHVSASIGASIAPEDGRMNLERMMEDADTALYAVKENGRHGYRIYTPEMGRMGTASP